MPDENRRGGPIRSALLALCVVHLALILTGCAKTQAANVPDGPPLAVPAAPPRVIAPVADEPLAENPPEPDNTPAPPRTNTTPARPTPRPRPPATATTPTEEPKPEAPAATPPAVADAPRPVPTQADLAAERVVRDVIRKASSDLGRIYYQGLSTNGKAQYEQAKGFIEQAERELKERSYTFAKTVADKAAALATELLGR